jgi:Flp pilus assembly protein TadG
MYVGNRSCRGRRGRRRGAAATELALILPLLVTLVLAAVDYGRFVSLYISLANAARAGAQYGAMNNFSSSTQSTWTGNVQAAAVNEISGQYSGFSSSNVTVTPSATFDANGVRNVTVTATYPFTTLINWQWTGLGLPHTMTISQQAQLPMIR